MKRQHTSRVDLDCNPAKKPHLSSGLDDSNDMDISLLQRPLRTASTGFQEAKRAFEDGTSEVRRLLLQECSIIYECNVCRNMFRSLANFISHKRVFCTTSSSSTAVASCGGGGYYNGLNPHSTTSMIIQTKTQDQFDKRSRSMGSSPTRTEARSAARGSMRDLSGVIERLRREQETKAEGQNINSGGGGGGDTVLQLESLSTNNHAVYQTIKRQEKDKDSMKTEVNEVHHLLTNVQTTLGPDGKAVTKHSYADNTNKANNTEEASDNEDGETSENGAKIVCETCKLTFQTEKTLKIHIQKKHSLSSYVFQCPACSLTFLQAAAVIRHLSKEHKKPTRRIRLMRDSILKRCIQQGDVQTKGPSRELKRLQMNDAVGSAAAAVVAAENCGEKRKIMSSCIYCEKSFERRAALSSHLLNCRAKQAALQKPVLPVAKRYKHSLPPTEATINEDEEIESDIKLKDDEKVVKEEKKATEEEEDTEQHKDTQLLKKLFADLDKKSETLNSSIQTINLDEIETSNAEITHFTDSEHDGTIGNEGSSLSESNNKTKDEKPHTKQKKTRNVPAEKQLKCRCKICAKQFNALSNLRRHISMFHYRARRFGCKVCEYRAFRRYDIVNHLGFLHKIDMEREKLSADFVITYDCKYSKADVDKDIVLLNEEDEPEAAAVSASASAVSLHDEEIDNNVSVVSETKIKVVKTYEKRLKRKTETNTTATESKDQHGPPKMRQRRTTNYDESSNTKDGEKRPIRKRVKAENKDFVYDLSRLLKTDANTAAVAMSSATVGPPATTTSAPSLSEATRQKRSSTNLSVDSNDTEQNQKISLEKPRYAGLITEGTKPLVRGATRRIMLKLVTQGLAVSATLPELPAERPQIRPRPMSQVRSSISENVTITKPMAITTSTDTKNSLASTNNDSFIEKIAKRTAAAANTDTNAINNLIRKVESLPSGDITNNSSKCNTEASQKLKGPLDNVDVTEHVTLNGQLQEQEEVAPTPPEIGPSRRMSIFPPLPRLPSPLPIESYVETTLESLLRSALQN